MQTKEQLIDWIGTSASNLWETQIADKGDDDSLAPIFFGFCSDPEEPLLIIPAQWGGEDEKVAILSALKMLFKEKKVSMYGHVSETWVSELKVEPGADPRDSMHSPPSEDPNRKEYLMFMAVDSAGAIVRRRQIIRPEDGAPAKLGPFEDIPSTMEGRMLDLLKDVDNFSNPVTMH